MSRKTHSKWICCQLGAREHYAVPRALFAGGYLDHLITDMWTSPGSLFYNLSGDRSRERYHRDLEAASVTSWNWSQAFFELSNRSRKRRWHLITARNDWFQRRAASALQLATTAGSDSNVFFSYSYAARIPFEVARRAGLTTVLGQIDPGPQEERLVARLHAASPHIGGEWQPAPAQYWQQWRQECDLADRIVVNSEWSRVSLISEGISASKLHLIPLVYNPPPETVGFVRSYPPRFTPARPMRVLFLGQVNLRKGIGPIMEAITLLAGLPIQFRMVGPIQVTIPKRLRNHQQVQWAGPVPRGSAAAEYRKADVFLFPTISDGFGLTQLEAQAWALPVIASRNCGEVVNNGVNGIVLPDVSAESIATTLLSCLSEPDHLQQFSTACHSRTTGLASLQDALVACVT